MRKVLILWCYFMRRIKVGVQRPWRRAFLQGGECKGFAIGLLVAGDSIPSVLRRKCLSLSENCGLGIVDAKDLKSGVS